MSPHMDVGQEAAVLAASTGLQLTERQRDVLRVVMAKRAAEDVSPVFPRRYGRKGQPMRHADDGHLTRRESEPG